MAFNSDNFIFRSTPLGDALVKAGLAKAPVLQREPKREGLLRQRHDRANILPSVRIPLNPRTAREEAVA